MLWPVLARLGLVFFAGRLVGSFVLRRAVGCLIWVLLLLFVALILLSVTHVHAQSGPISPIRLSPGLPVHTERHAQGIVGSWSRTVTLPRLPAHARIVIAGDPTGFRPLAVDDVLRLQISVPGQPLVTVSQSFDRPNGRGIQFVSPLDLTRLLSHHTVHITVQYIDLFPPRFWGSPLWLVVLTPSPPRSMATPPTPHPLLGWASPAVIVGLGALSVLSFFLARRMRQWLDYRGIWRHADEF